MLYLVAAVQQNWAIISSTIKLAWDVIAGIIRTGTALVLAIVFTFLAIFTGRWDIAWKYIQNLVTVAWNSVKAIFNSALGFIGSWAGAVYNQLTSPFKRAWSTIQDLVNKIKGALDFTKRHSPSVLDIVNRGVRLVNSAMSNLDFTPALNQLPSPSDFGNMFDNINANSSIVNQSNIFNVNTGMDARTIAERLAFDLRNTQ
ncbi:MAG: hypothetical protein MOGMAGMI_01787 [Candidatus Omnitrophica bacterium]|nr:hypothetical protein [Candidatus Omnitrophota bacterium]